jgi:alkanesulfonate monooxygenase SsuD/methylene tetrahydromethanopterin reductase-like flavin-dependent oxidoreductase (luciferase family)
MQVGIDSFAAFDDAGSSLNPSERLRRVIEQIEYADKIGLDVFGIGEHHRRIPRFSSCCHPGCCSCANKTHTP